MTTKHEGDISAEEWKLVQEKTNDFSMKSVFSNQESDGLFF